MQLYQENNTDEIEDLNGQSRKFKVLARLLPKKGRFDKNSRYNGGQDNNKAE
jgi:hypothetical protein